MKLTRSFLSSLQQRLTVESRRGVHLHAIPGRSRLKLDASALVSFSPFMPFPVAIETGSHEAFPELDRKLSLLHFEVEDILSEKGIHTFGFGYPLLIRRDSRDKIVVAPILIWPLQLARFAKSGQWLISKNEEDGVLVNEVLVRHLERECGAVLDGLYDWMDEGKLESPHQLEAMMIYLSEKLSPPNFAKANNTNKAAGLVASPMTGLFSEGLEAIPSRASLDNMPASVQKIHWGGLFAVFEVRHQNLLYDYDALLQLENIELHLDDLPATPQHQLSLVKTDPAQQAILDALSVKRTLLIHGPPGTGKSQTLTAIIVNALTKGQKVLVVCGKQTALQVILDQLEQMELDNLAAIVKEVKKDRRTIVNKVRQVVDERTFFEGEGTLFARNDFAQTEAEGRLLLLEREKRRHFYSQKIWGDFTFGDIVALLLQIPKGIRTGSFVEGVQNFVSCAGDFPLGPGRDGGITQNFEYTRFAAAQLVDVSTVDPLCWSNTTRLLQEGEPLYQAVLPYLEKYQPLAFATAEYPVVTKQLQEQILRIETQLEAIEKQYSEFESQARKYLQGKYEHIYQQVQQQIDLVRNYLSKISTTSTVSRENLSREQQYGLQYYHQLCEFLVEEEGPVYEPGYSEQPEDILAQLQDIKASINDWKRNWPHLITEQINQVGQTSGREVWEELPGYLALQALMEDLVDEVNRSGYFVVKTGVQDKLSETMDLLRQQKKDLELLADSGLPELQQWAVFFFSHSEKDQRLITALASKQNWAERYSAYVLQHQLTKQPIPRWDAAAEATLEKLPARLEKHQIPFIQSQWRERQRVSAIRFQQQQRMEVAQLYNKRSTAAGRKFSLREIVAKDLQLFQSFFPVLLTTPETASLLFRDYGQEEIVDLVLYDEASQLKVEEGIPTFLKGRQVVIAGDEHQMPPAVFFGEAGEVDAERGEYGSDIPSWLDFASTLPNIGHGYLDFHYRSMHPALIDFSNAAFYGGRLCPMPPQMMEIPITFRNIAGIYTEGLNEAEAEDVVSLLQKTERSADGFYPSIGIATFNVKQRNLILEKINRLERQSPSFAAKMIALREKGLFVKNLENIQGDERDLLIISTVYGKGENGKFSARFGPINQEGGYKLLNVLITRAKFKIIVCSSVPEKVFRDYALHLQTDGNDRKAIFYAWLAYAKAVSEGEVAIVEDILSNLRRAKTAEREHIVRNSLFVDLVYERLLLQLENGQLYKYAHLGGYMIDILYEAADGKRHLYICDGWNEEAIVSGFEGHPGMLIRWVWSGDWL